MSPRRYEQRRRAELAGHTRRRIIGAVIERLRDAPAERISLRRIAETAGVDRSTVYAVFGSRAGLFDAVGADVFERGGYGRLVAAARRPDPREQLRGGIRAASEMWAADRDVVRALHSMAQLDEAAVGDSVRRWEDERSAAMRRIARGLDAQGELQQEVRVDQAEQILWVLTSFESFDLLFSGRSLSTDAVAELLIAAAERAVCK